ncbi:MAG: GNVR domain-containing protein [Candidatus Sulfotelmatobacter sp.]
MTATPTTGPVEAFPAVDASLPTNGDRHNGDHHLRIEEPNSNVFSSDTSVWLWILWERRRLLLRALACGLGISVLLAFAIPKRYDSTTRLMPPDGQSGSGLAMLAAMAGKSGTAGMGEMAGSLLGLRSSGALFIDILRSRTVEDRIVSRFDLRKVYGDRYWVDARKRLEKNTDLEEDRKSEVITIRVTDRNPQRAAQMAQAYVDELDHLVAEVSTSSAHRERIFIEDRLTSVKRELDRASQEFSQFSSQNATLDIAIQGKTMVEAAARLQGELIAAQSELESLEQIYTGNNIRVRSLRARVDELSKQLDKLDGTKAASQTAASSASTDSASTGLTGDFPSIRQLPLLGVRWADLYRQTKIEETVYELLTQQYELAKIEEAKETPTVKILDAADVPERKSFPPRMAVVVFGTMLALALAMIGIFGGILWRSLNPDGLAKVMASAFAQRARQAAGRCGANRLFAAVPWLVPVESREDGGGHSLQNATGKTS